MSTANVLKTFVLALAGMVGIFFGVGALLADRWVVESVRTVTAPPARVAPLLGDFEAWERWSTMRLTLGPQVQRTVEGEPGRPGHRVVWSGAAGRASLTIVRADAGAIAYEYHSHARDDAAPQLAGTGSITIAAEGEGTRVTWRDEGSWPDYAGRWFGWFGGLQVRVQQIQTTSLAGLQEALEQDPPPK
ncbi:MAG: hypothetical protein FJ265_18195 [Planctomycetes bacterium]|nr:hypothetical protein [Planctomycetota bacterium]